MAFPNWRTIGFTYESIVQPASQDVYMTYTPLSSAIIGKVSASCKSIHARRLCILRERDLLALRNVIAICTEHSYWEERLHQTRESR